MSKKETKEASKEEKKEETPKEVPKEIVEETPKEIKQIPPEDIPITVSPKVEPLKKGEKRPPHTMSYDEYKELIRAYKKQNPVKYAMKKESLKKRLLALKK